jgi:hypothetical protein
MCQSSQVKKVRGKRRHISNEFIDNYLKENNRLIERCSDFVDSRTKMKWKCLVDGYEWITVPTPILRKNLPSCCPKCVGGVRHSYEEVVKILEEHNIILLQKEYLNYRSPLQCECIVCGFLFNKSLHGIQKSVKNVAHKTACPSCNNRHDYTNEYIDNLLKKENREIERISDVKSAKEQIDWMCLVCHHKWSAAPQHVLGMRKQIGSGCPVCKNKKEKLLKKYLIENVKCDYFKHQYKIYIDNEKRYIDFCLIKGDNVYFIERNGEQHYRPIRFNGISKEKADENFIKQQSRDCKIINFCQEYNIKLIVIKYDMDQKEIEEIFKNI